MLAHEEFLGIIVEEEVVHSFVQVFQSRDGWLFGLVAQQTNARVMFEVFVLEVGQMHDIFGLFSEWSDIQFLQFSFVDDYDALEAFSKGLQF